MNEVKSWENKMFWNLWLWHLATLSKIKKFSLVYCILFACCSTVISVQILANIESPNDHNNRACRLNQTRPWPIHNLKHTTAQKLIEVFINISTLAPAPWANKRENMARAAESEIHEDGLKGEDGSTYIKSGSPTHLLRSTVYGITRLVFSTESS